MKATGPIRFTKQNLSKRKPTIISEWTRSYVTSRAAKTAPEIRNPKKMTKTTKTSFPQMMACSEKETRQTRRNKGISLKKVTATLSRLKQWKTVGILEQATRHPVKFMKSLKRIRNKFSWIFRDSLKSAVRIPRNDKTREIKRIEMRMKRIRTQEEIGEIQKKHEGIEGSTRESEKTRGN